MKIFILMLLTITIFATQQSDFVNRNNLLYKNNKLFTGVKTTNNSEFIYKDGVIQKGIWFYKNENGEALYKNGNKQSESLYEDGKIIKRSYWYENGNKKSETLYKERKITQKISWDKNGNITSIIKNRDPHVTFSEDLLFKNLKDVNQSQTTYKDGLFYKKGEKIPFTGKIIGFFKGNNQLFYDHWYSETIYKNGYKEVSNTYIYNRSREQISNKWDRFNIFYKNNERYKKEYLYNYLKKWEIIYVNDRIYQKVYFNISKDDNREFFREKGSRLEKFYDNQNKIERECEDNLFERCFFSKNNKNNRDRIEKVFKEDILTREYDYRNNKLTHKITYYKNGNKKSEIGYKDDKLDGYSISWDKDGKLISKILYKNGRVIDNSKKAENNKKLEVNVTEDIKVIYQSGYFNPYYQNHTNKLTKIVENIPTAFKSNKYFRREYFVKNNKINGTYTLWNEDGKIESETFYKDGLQDGKFIEYLKDGKLTHYYKNGLIQKSLCSLNGKKTAKVEKISNKKKILDFYCKNGKVDGKFLSWYRNGNKKEIFFYKNGLLHGKQTIWGRSIINYKNGLLDGKSTVWPPNGHRIESFYKNNILQKEIKYNGRKTKEISRIRYYKRGKLKKEVSYSGKNIIEFKNYRNKKLHGKYLYDSRKIKKSQYSEDEYDGEKKFIKGYYKNGKKVGKWINNTYMDKVIYSKIEHYKNGLLDGRYSNKDECGTIKGYYKNGKRSGEWKYFTDNGECEGANSIQHYKNGLLDGYSISGGMDGESYYKMYKKGVITCSIGDGYDLIYSPIKIKNNLIKIEKTDRDTEIKTTLYYDKNCNMKKSIKYSLDGIKNIVIGYKNKKISKSFYPNGGKRHILTYKNEKKNGKYIFWYKNGKKKFEFSYKNDIIDGKLTKWKKNGKKDYEQYYSNGDYCKYISWGIKGKQTGDKCKFEFKKGLAYQDGKLYTGIYVIFEKWSKLSEVYYIDGKKEGKEIVWYNGEKHIIRFYKNGKKDGKETYFNEDGTLSSTGFYKDGKEDGKYQSWHDNGKKRSEVYYKNGKQNGKELRWYDNGKKEFEAFYIDGRGKEVGWDIDGKKRYESYYVDGKQNGKEIRYENGKIKSESLYKDGKKESEIYYIDEKLDGKEIKHYDNGKIKSETFYKDGKKIKIISWYKTGEKEAETFYKSGKQNGKKIRWYKTGKKESESFYKEGKKEGEDIWWYDNGQKWLERFYKNGKQNGKKITWYKNGQKKSESFYKEGKKEDKEIKWYDNGIKLYETFYKDGKEDGKYQSWYTNGEKRSKTFYKNGKKDGKYQSWYMNGKKRDKILYKDGKEDGKYQSWHDNGKKESETFYKDGKKDGKYQSWYMNGKKQNRILYKNGKKEGKYQSWYINGKKRSESFYKDGKQNGKEIIWNDDGTKYSEINYKNGIQNSLGD